MPQGVIFFSLIHLGAQLSLWALSTGTLLFIAHRNFKIYSADLCACLCVCVSVCLCLCASVNPHHGVCQGVNVLKHGTEIKKKLENVLLTQAFEARSIF